MTKRTKSKSGHKQQEDTSFLLESPMPQTRGIGEYVLPGLLFLIVVLGGSTVCWCTLQQQSSIDQLTQSYSAMQMRITKFQQVMGMRDAQASQGSLIEERILALEETQRQAQSKVEVALETTQLLKNSDLSSQVWSLHAEMDAWQAEVEQVAVSAAALRAAVMNKSEEIEAVKRSVADILSANSALAVSVAGVTGAVAGVEAKLDNQVDEVASFTAGLEGQASELGELTVTMDLHKVALEANNQQVAEIKEMLVAEQTRRALALEEQLQSVKQTLDEQLSSSQNLHSNLKAQLEAVHSQITNGVQPGSDPEEIEPLTEEALPITEEEEEEAAAAESSSLGEEQEATEKQDKETVEEELVELATVDEGTRQEQEVEDVTEEPAEQEVEDVTEEPAELEVEDVTEEPVEQEVEDVTEEPAEQEETEESSKSEVTGEVVEQDIEEVIEEEPLIEEQGDEETSEEEVIEEEQAIVEEEPVELPGTMSTQEEQLA